MEKSDDPLLQPVAKRYPDHQWLLKAGLASAVFIGFGRAVIQTWDLFYNNWKENPLFKDLRETREKAKAALSNTIQTSGMDYKDISTEMKTIENKWSSAFNKRLFEKMGIESEGPWGRIKGTWQRFDSLGNHTKPKIVFGTVLTTSAAVAGYMLMNQNASMKRDMRSMQYKLAEERNNELTKEAQR
jgi:hypothetical protein